MATASLVEVQRLVDQLTPLEQARLLEYLAPRIVQVVTTTQPEPTVQTAEMAEAWQVFFRIGDALAASDRPELPTLTQAVQAMRR